VNRGIAAADTDREQFGDFFGDGEEARHGFKRAASVIGIQAGDDHPFTKIRELGANVDNFVAEELRFVYAMTSVRGNSFSMISEALNTLSEGMPRPECDTISLAA